MPRVALSVHHDDLENPFTSEPSLLARSYAYEPLYAAGVAPFILPAKYTREILDVLLADIDGVIMYGGFDIHPELYGEMISSDTVHTYHRRDADELLLTQYCLEHSIPLRGICRGLQIINIAQGGTLYQDIATEYDHPEKLIHECDSEKRQELAHDIYISEHGFLADVYRTDTIRINSFHHQAIKKLGKELAIVATAPDGIVEAIQHTSLPCRAVQRHPEFIYDRDETARKLFARFAQQTRRYAAQKMLRHF